MGEIGTLEITKYLQGIFNIIEEGIIQNKNFPVINSEIHSFEKNKKININLKILIKDDHILLDKNIETMLGTIPISIKDYKQEIRNLKNQIKQFEVSPVNIILNKEPSNKCLINDLSQLEDINKKYEEIIGDLSNRDTKDPQVLEEMKKTLSTKPIIDNLEDILGAELQNLIDRLKKSVGELGDLEELVKNQENMLREEEKQKVLEKKQNEDKDEKKKVKGEEPGDKVEVPNQDELQKALIQELKTITDELDAEKLEITNSLDDDASDKNKNWIDRINHLKMAFSDKFVAIDKKPWSKDNNELLLKKKEKIYKDIEAFLIDTGIQYIEKLIERFQGSLQDGSALAAGQGRGEIIDEFKKKIGGVMQQLLNETIDNDLLDKINIQQKKNDETISKLKEPIHTETIFPSNIFNTPSDSIILTLIYGADVIIKEKINNIENLISGSWSTNKEFLDNLQISRANIDDFIINQAVRLIGDIKENINQDGPEAQEEESLLAEYSKIWKANLDALRNRIITKIDEIQIKLKQEKDDDGIDDDSDWDKWDEI